MQVMITYGRAARMRMFQFHRWQLALAAAALVALLLAVSGAVYHMVFLKAAREGWPVIGQLVRLVVRGEIEQRDRFMRENLDAMAQRLGEMQAKLIKLEAIGERVAKAANVKPEDIKPLQRTPTTGAAAPAPLGLLSAAPGAVPVEPSPGAVGLAVATVGALGASGGPYVPGDRPSLRQLQSQVQRLDEATDFDTDLFTLMESRLQESSLAGLTLPSDMPLDTPYTSAFGFRPDPFTGRQALHTGLDFPAEQGTPIRAASGGQVVHRESHPAYGEMIEIDHGNEVVTRYAHCSSIDVKVGAVVRRGQVIARVGSTGRSTGPHLHFEVLVRGVQHDPARFLAGSLGRAAPEFAARPTLRQ
jgi:murein DD-endopeptidase MepM/ murein hydrolase activator NlpD